MSGDLSPDKTMSCDMVKKPTVIYQVRNHYNCKRTLQKDSMCYFHVSYS